MSRRHLVPGSLVEAYAGRPSVVAGESIDLMASTEAPAEIRVLRLEDAPGSAPGVGRPVSWGPTTTSPARVQPLLLGSHVEIPAAPQLSPPGGFAFSIWMLPTAVSARWHAVAARWSPGELSWLLALGGQHAIHAAVSVDGQRAHFCTAAEAMRPDEWQRVELSWDPAGRLEVRIAYSAEPGAEHVAYRDGPPGNAHAGDAPLLLGALPPADDEVGHWAHYNGRLARPQLRALDGPVIGEWSLGATTRTTHVADVSGAGWHGRTVNGPTRGVAGPDWSDPPHQQRAHVTPRYRSVDAPDLFDAIHLHEDDLHDAGWAPLRTLDVPEAALPGIHAAHLATARGDAFAPFVVRPAAPTAPVLFLCSTLTWQAYGSNRMVFSSTYDGILDAAPCSYDLHTDGTIVYHTAWRRPARSMDPRVARREQGTNGLAADLHVTAWLAHEQTPYDVACDHDLHAEGAGLLRPYRVVVIGPHPEYWTHPMVNALKEYLAGGGRVILLGGNAIQHVSSLDHEHVLEVRKQLSSDAVTAPVRRYPAEHRHVVDGAPGGRAWPEAGVAVHRLTGVESAAYAISMFEPGELGFHRSPASHDARFAWLFDGVDEDPIGAYGAVFGTAAGYEGDAYPGTDDDGITTVLAAAAHERMAPMTDVLPPEMHLAFTEHPRGGACFTAGSMTWAAALSHSSWDNGARRLTGNVLRRFLDTPPHQSVL